LTPIRTEADTLHLGISADVTFQRSLDVGHGRRPQSSGTYPLGRDRSTDRSVVVPVAKDQGVWLSLRSSEPVALQVVVDGVNATDGSTFKGAFDPSAPDHVVLPEHRWIDGVSTSSRTLTALHGPAADEDEVTILLVARRLRGAAFRRWWVESGAAERANRLESVIDVAGGRSTTATDPAAASADGWDRDPFDVVAVRLLTPSRWSSVTGSGSTD
jgi:hypothetical protein